MVSRDHPKTLKLTIVAGLLLLLLLVISSMIFFSLQGKKNTQGHPGNAVVTVTPAQSTPSPTLAASSTPQPLFFDNFTGPDEGWYVGDSAGYTRLIATGTLLLADTNHTILTESLPASKTFDDFTLTVTFTLIEAGPADSVGLYLRGDTYLDHDYRIDVYGDNTYSVSKEFVGADGEQEIAFLAGPTTTPSLNPLGRQNTLTVMMKGPQMVLEINGSIVNSLTDFDYTKGQIALFVQNSPTSNEAEATFSSIAVYPAPGQLPPG